MIVRRLLWPMIAASVNGSVFNSAACGVPNVWRRLYRTKETPAAIQARSWLLFNLVM